MQIQLIAPSNVEKHINAIGSGSISRIHSIITTQYNTNVDVNPITPINEFFVIVFTINICALPKLTLKSFKSTTLKSESLDCDCSVSESVFFC